MDNIDLQTAIAWTEALAAGPEAERISQCAPSLALNRLRAKVAGILVCAPGQDEFLPEAHNITAEGYERLPIQSPCVPLAEALELLQNKEGPDVLAFEAESDATHNSGYTIEHLLCARMRAGGKTVGVMFVRRGKCFEMAEHSELRFLCTLSASALQNARRHTTTDIPYQVREILNTNILGILIWERGGKIIEANEAFLRFLDYVGHEGSFPMSLDALTPDEWKPAIDRREALFRSGGVLPPFEREFFRRDGSKAPALVTATRLGEGADRRVTFVLDLTHRKQTEEALAKTKAELAHVAKISALSALTGSIAHEINQPLTAIVANGSAAIRWLNRPTPRVEEALESVERMVLDGHRAGAVISGIRSLLKKHPGKTEPINLNELIETTVRLFRHDAARSKVQITLELAPNLRSVNGDAVQLQQLLGNLFVNGIEAMLDLPPEARSMTMRSTAEGNWVQVSVHDAGKGPDLQTIDRIFDPFFTTKQEGLGMGLSICKLIVDAHQGRLWVNRADNGHTVFRFALPIGAAEGLRS
ncbi:sensor histidine kinase [Cupriavidus pauculus]|uniref:histidine kinase n=1 Tax=Cupriavidus pauculus TaxID=82633 RepID=A0A2N5C8A9_9BURK|nr:ATP-binding protein [Cupriavidus pauculus]PLP98440.1 hypothetical protein CYJ10_21340 [Cupriavidus pauculus]